MATDFKSSRTFENLQKAFAGESQARVKYQFFASKAKKEGFEQISAIFSETSDNEKEHAKIWYKLMNDGVGSTAENLKAAAEGEAYEYKEMYKEFAEIAREEGFEEIAKKFELVGEVEKEHEDRYRKLLENVDDDVVFKGDDVTVWRCRNCGYVFVGDEAPETCPVCDHPRAYFERAAKNY